MANISAPVDSNGDVVNSTSYLNSTSATKTNSNSSLDKDAFLQLLVAEMQNQDPLEPSSNSDYVAQLATFSQVEELQNVSNSMSQSQASNLVGKIVIMQTESSSGAISYIDGTVERVYVEAGKTYLGVKGSLYDLADLVSVIDESVKDKYTTLGTTTDSNTGNTGNTGSESKNDTNTK